MKNIFTNLSTEELTVLFGSKEYKIPHSGYERCTLVKDRKQEIPEDQWVTITFDREIMNANNKDKDLDGVGHVDIIKPGTFAVMFQAKGADKYRITKNGASLLESDSGASVVLNFAAKDEIALQAYGKGEIVNSNTHLSVIRVY